MCQGVARRAGVVASALVGGASGHCQKLSLRFFSGEGSHSGLYTAAAAVTAAIVPPRAAHTAVR